MALSRFVLPYADVGAGIRPSSGAKLFFYATGTSTLAITYADSTGDTPNTNPVIANANGVFPAIFLNGVFNVALKDANDVQIWTADPASYVVSAPVFATVAAMESATPQDVDGAAVTFTVGMWVTIVDYATSRNSGVMFGSVVAGSTGTADGGSYIDLANGTQWKQNFDSKGINVKQYGAVPGGVTNNGTALRALFAKSNVTIVFTPEIYAVSDLGSGLDMKGTTAQAAIFAYNVNNQTVKGNKATILWTGADPSSDGESRLLSYVGSATGATGSKNIIVNGLIFDYDTTPSVRVNNTAAVHFDGVTGFEISGCEVKSSWSAGFIYNRCNDGDIFNNLIENVLADGMTGFGCGKRFLVHNNRLLDTGDDAIAFTWFAVHLAADVGQSSIRTKNVVISENIIANSDARGIFLGGVDRAEVSNNLIDNTIRWGIGTANDSTTVGTPFYDTSATSTNSLDVTINNNIVKNGGNKDDETYGGIRAAHYCTGVIIGNLVTYAADIGITTAGVFDIINNTINNLQNSASVKSGKGLGIRCESDPSAVAQSSGVVSGNTIEGSVNAPAIMVGNCGVGAKLTVKDNTAINCVATNASSDVTGIFMQSSGGSQRVGTIFKNNTAQDDRTDSGLSVIKSVVRVEGGSLVIQSGNEFSIADAHAGFADGEYSQDVYRAYRYANRAYNPGTLAVGSSIESGNLAVTGSKIGDQVSVAADINISGYIVSGTVVSSNNVKLTVSHMISGAGDTLGSINFTITTKRVGGVNS
jgi:hypothetical protein